MVWTVVSSTNELPAGALAGSYGGVSADASVAVGGGANVLVGGSKNGHPPAAQRTRAEPADLGGRRCGHDAEAAMTAAGYCVAKLNMICDATNRRARSDFYRICGRYGGRGFGAVAICLHDKQSAPRGSTGNGERCSSARRHSSTVLRQRRCRGR